MKAVVIVVWADSPNDSSAESKWEFEVGDDQSFYFLPPLHQGEPYTFGVMDSEEEKIKRVLVSSALVRTIQVEEVAEQVNEVAA